jgi:hypothetical protein
VSNVIAWPWRGAGASAGVRCCHVVPSYSHVSPVGRHRGAEARCGCRRRRDRGPRGAVELPRVAEHLAARAAAAEHDEHAAQRVRARREACASAGTVPGHGHPADAVVAPRVAEHHVRRLVDAAEQHGVRADHAERVEAARRRRAVLVLEVPLLRHGAGEARGEDDGEGERTRVSEHV